MNVCVQCQKPLQTKYAKKFCSRSCSATFNNKKRIWSEETKKKIGKSVQTFHKRLPKKQYEYVCDKCSVSFISNVKKRKNRPIRCNGCKRKTKKATKDVDSILCLSGRTIKKLLKRAKFSCVMCGWNRTTLDIHHVVPKSKGGTNEHSNLIALCPNCHRLAHEKSYSKEELKKKTLDKTFQNWRKFYYV